MELSGGDTGLLERVTQLLKPQLVAVCQVDVGRVMVRGTAMLVSVFKGGVASLDRLLRERDVPARDGIQIGFGGRDLLHGKLLVGWWCTIE